MKENHKITKAVLPVAGLGTRMLPATKAIPKEMLPVVDKPLIQYIVNECVTAGITEIILVNHSSKSAIENHFDTSYELETELDKKAKKQLLDEVRAIAPENMTIISVRQGEAKGLGHAVLCALPAIGYEPFAVLLPDVLIDEVESDLSTENLAKMMALYEETGESQIMVEPVPMENVSSYGVVDIKGKELSMGDYSKIEAVVEKPPQEEAPSNLAIVGRYVLSARVWDFLKATPPGAGGEIQLTDAIDMLIKEETVNAFQISGKSHDCGSKIGYMQANIVYGMRHEQIGKDFTQFINDIKT